MATRFASVLLILLALAACDQHSMVESQKEVQFAKQYFALFQSRDFDAIEAKLDPKLKDQQLKANLEQVAAAFPTDRPKNVAVVSFNRFSLRSIKENFTRYTIELQYEYPSKWLLAQTVLEKRDDGSPLVAGLHVYPLPDSLQNINRFTLNNKPLGNYVVLAIAVINPLLTVCAFVLCLRTPIRKRKWLWLIFVLIGFMQFTVNWTNGAFNINPISFELLGAGFTRASSYAPVLLTVSLPIGALVFLVRRRKWLCTDTTAATEPSPPVDRI